MNDVFSERCTNDPAGVIKDLLAQTTRQAKAISDLNKDIARLAEMLTAAGIDSTKPPEPKVKGRKKKVVEEDGLPLSTDS